MKLATAKGEPVTGTFGGRNFDNKGELTVTVKGGESLTLTGIPVDAVYTVTEKAVENFKPVDDVTGTITVDDAEADFTNTRETGDLTISKKVVSDVEADATAEYEFTVTLGDNTIEGDFRTDGGKPVKFEKGVATVKVKGGASVKIIGLPTEVTYTVAEAEVENFEPVDDVTGTMTVDGAKANFTNTRKLGDLTIKKTVVSPYAPDHSATYSFTVQLKQGEGDLALDGTYKTTDGSDVVFEGGEATVEVKGDSSVTITGLPRGIGYTVTEAEVKGFTTTPVTREHKGTLGEKATATFTNTRKTGERTVYGEATVNKVDGSDNSALPGATFVLYADEAQTQEIYTYTSDEKGAFKISTDDKSLEGRLPGVGESVTYYLVETEAPKGYRLEGEPRKVVISASLKHAIENDVYTAITTYAITIEGKAALTVPNPPITDEKVEHSHVTVNKQDDSGVALKGAEFTLYSGETAITTFGGADVDSFTIKTDDPKLAGYLPKTDESTTLTLKETKAPTGYQLSGDEYSVVIKKTVVTDWNTGHTALVTTTTYDITIDGKASLVVKNEPAPTPTATPTPTPTPTPNPPAGGGNPGPTRFPGSTSRAARFGTTMTTSIMSGLPASRSSCWPTARW